MDWWTGLPGTSWSAPLPPRVWADRMVALAIAVRAHPPDRRHLSAGLNRSINNYADRLAAWLGQDPDNDRAGYTRRVVLCEAASVLGPGADADQLVQLADGMYRYATEEKPAKRSWVA